MGFRKTWIFILLSLIISLYFGMKYIQQFPLRPYAKQNLQSIDASPFVLGDTLRGGNKSMEKPNRESKKVRSIDRNEHPEFDADSGLLTCRHMRRPSVENHARYKGYYHQFSPPPHSNGSSSHAYVLGVYHDARAATSGGEDMGVIRTISTANFELANHTLFAVLWYSGVRHGVVVPCTVKYATNGAPIFGPNNVWYDFVKYDIRCKLPQNITAKTSANSTIVALPGFVSLMTGDECAKPTNYIPLTKPLPPDPNDRFKLGNCMQSLYGKFTNTTAFMFINWMETITLYGISEVTVNLNNFTNTAFGEQILQYYQKSGVLKITNYPDVIPVYPKQRESLVGRVQSFILLPFMDCVFKNMYRYWYVVPHDVDELFVLKDGSTTYQEYLKKYLKKHSETVDSAFLSVYHAGFYLNNPADARAPEYLTYVRYTKRDQVTKAHLKSFQNPRICVYPGYHTCESLRTADDRFKESYAVGSRLLPVEEIVLHHYRNTRFGRKPTNITETVNDPYVMQGPIGGTIKERVTRTLTKLGYFK